MLVLSAFILGLFVGSFINAVLFRVGTKRKLGWARSICPHCKHELTAADLVPLLSFAALRGRCRYCGKPISWHYPVVELVSGALFALIAWRQLANFSSISPDDFPLLILDSSFVLAVAGWFIFIAAYDIKKRVILTSSLIPLGYVVLAYHAWHLVLTHDVSFALWALAAGATAFIFFASLYFVSAGKWMGGGDVRLSFILGAILGRDAFLGFFLAFLLGSAVGGALILLSSGKKSHELPFGPYLVAGAMLALLLGEEIVGVFYKAIAGLYS